MTTSIEQRNPPTQIRRLLSARDAEIVDALTIPRRPVEVARELDRKTREISSRMRELTRRGWLRYESGASPHGPGARLYVAVDRDG